jgi:hypothetical protein
MYGYVDTAIGVDALFIGKSGFTIFTGIDMSFKPFENVSIDPKFGLGYVYYNNFYIGGILNIIPRTQYCWAEVFIAPTFIIGFDFGGFLLGGQISYMRDIDDCKPSEERNEFKFFLGFGVNVLNNR